MRARQGASATDGGTRLFTPAFITLTIAELAYFTAFGVMIPAVPLFARGPIGADEFGVGLAVGAFSVTALILRPWAGHVSDRRGRRPLLVIGAVAFALISAAHIVIGDLAALIVLRLGLGVAEALFFVAGVAALADLAPPGRAGEAVSYNSLALYLGIAFGPLVGETLIGLRGYDAAWLAAAVLGAVAAMLVWRMPETGTIVASNVDRPAVGFRLLHRAALGPSLALFTGVLAMAGFLAFIALFSRDVGLGGSQLVLLAFGLTVVVTRVLFARLPDRVPGLTLGSVSLGLTGSGLIIAAVSSEGQLLIVAAIVAGVGIAFMTPALFATIFARVRPDDRGSAMGTASLFLDLGFGGGPLLLGIVASAVSIPAAFMFGGAIALVGGLATAAVALRSRAARS